MACVQPFGALRFTQRAGKMEELVCPPYDIINDQERKEYLARNPHNIIRLELPREGENPYQTAGETLTGWLQQEILACDADPGFYLYEESFEVAGEKKRIQGLIGMVRLEEFEKGTVLPHEETLSKAKTDRFNLMCATGCNFSNVYSLYFDVERVLAQALDKAALQPSLLDFQSDDGLGHKVWKIADAASIEQIADAFSDKKLYIADGHHRYETAINYRNHLRGQHGGLPDDHPANFVMMTLVSIEHPGLVVFPTHRVVRGLPAFDLPNLLAGCKEYFSVETSSPERIEAELTGLAAQDKKAFGLYCENQTFLLTLEKPEVLAKILPDLSEVSRMLDVTVLHTLILERLLGIDKENMLSQKNLTYTRDLKEAFSLVDAGEANCTFLLNPTRVAEIAAVAGAGEKMPQKSTYFYPKLITGHIMRLITTDLV